jgi:hypothetical protein
MQDSKELLDRIEDLNTIINDLKNELAVKEKALLVLYKKLILPVILCILLNLLNALHVCLIILARFF